MNRNLLNMELRKNVVTLIVWSLIIIFLISVTMSVYRTFLQNQSKITGMLTLIPKGALEFKGISNFNDLLSVLGFYTANNVIYMLLLGSIYSIVLASNILLKEEYGKTAEYLLTRPVTRSEIYFSKLFVVTLYIFLLNLATSAAGLISIVAVKTASFSVRSFLILSLYTFLLNYLFAAAGLFISTLVRRPRPITTFSIGLVLVFYFIYTLSKITESAAMMGYISPFKYVSLDTINAGYRLEVWRVSYFLGLTILLISLSFRIYKRKDIYL
jgi:ABC-2 type transport system permease protein